MYHKQNGTYLGQFIQDKTMASTNKPKSEDNIGTKSSSPPSRKSDKEDLMRRVGVTWFIPGVDEYSINVRDTSFKYTFIHLEFKYKEYFMSFYLDSCDDLNRFCSFVVHNNIIYLRDFFKENDIVVPLTNEEFSEIGELLKRKIEPKMDTIVLNQTTEGSMRRLATKVALNSKWADIDLSKPDIQWESKVTAYKNAAGGDPVKKQLIEDWIARSKEHVEYINSPARLFPDTPFERRLHNKKVGL